MSVPTPENLYFIGIFAISGRNFPGFPYDRTLINQRRR
ncbi:hypothetical protein CKA32_003584 [Geitlerinema sp. FC II]|nr:hypothetical protein CKA32_003584 [Geitlerinema sp. FC II]